MCENFLGALDAILLGRFEYGQWYIFYDSNNQGELYNNFDQNMADKLKAFGAVDFYLTLNCRNTRPIAIQTSVVSGFQMADTLLETGEQVRYFWYNNLEDQIESVNALINKLVREGIVPQNITLLYPSGREEVKSALLAINTEEYTIKELTECFINSDEEETIFISSVQAYKGLENNVIILVNIDSLSSSWIETVNYVGMSRARNLLCVFLDAKVKSLYEEKIFGYIERRKDKT